MTDRSERDLGRISALLKLSQGALRLACEHNVQADKAIKALRTEVAALSARNREMEQALRRASQVSTAIEAMAVQTWPYAPLYVNGSQLPGRIVEEDLVRQVCKNGAELSQSLKTILADQGQPSRRA